MINIFNLWIN